VKKNFIIRKLLKFSLLLASFLLLASQPILLPLEEKQERSRKEAGKKQEYL
jgi:hypothetical protein